MPITFQHFDQTAGLVIVVVLLFRKLDSMKFLAVRFNKTNQDTVEFFTNAF